MWTQGCTVKKEFIEKSLVSLMPFYKYSSLVYFYTSDGRVRSVRIKIAFKDSRKLNFFYLIFFFLLVTSKLLKCKQFQLQMM